MRSKLVLTLCDSYANELEDKALKKEIARAVKHRVFMN